MYVHESVGVTARNSDFIAGGDLISPRFSSAYLASSRKPMENRKLKATMDGKDEWESGDLHDDGRPRSTNLHAGSLFFGDLYTAPSRDARGIKARAL